jgi:hypothetical protein
MLPEPMCGRQWIDIDARPPGDLVTAAMNLIMVDTAKRNSELVAHPAPHRAWLGKAEMVSLAGMTPAREAGLRRHEFEMTPVAEPRCSRHHRPSRRQRMS